MLKRALIAGAGQPALAKLTLRGGVEMSRASMERNVSYCFNKRPFSTQTGGAWIPESD